MHRRIAVLTEQALPFQFRDNDVFQTGDEQRDVFKFRWLASPELFLAESAGLAKNQVDLPAGSKIDHIEKRVPLQRSQSGIDILYVVFCRRKAQSKLLDLFRRYRDDEVVS